MGKVAAVTALEHLPSGAKRVRIWLDGEPFRTTNRRVTKALELRVGTKVQPEELTAQLDEEERRQSREHALRYLTYRARTSSELKRRLRQIGYGEAAVRETVGRLTAAGYLNDADFADAWVDERVRLKQFGRLRITAELVEKGLNPKEVQETLDSYCPEELERDRALGIGRKRLAGAHGLERVAKLRRLGPYLLRRGYTGAVVASVLEELAHAEDTQGQEAGRLPQGLSASTLSRKANARRDMQSS